MFQKHLRHLRLLALLAAAPFAALAQTGGVGIGTTAPDASAALDIISSTKGLLLPRVADATALATPAAGLLVYQTGGTPGFYYNAGNAAAPSWQQLATANGAAFTVTNGLVKTGSAIGLGGPLTQATTVSQAGFNLNLAGSGNVGIGTGTSPAAKLTVQPATNAEVGLRVTNGVADGPTVSGNIVLQTLTGGDSGFSFLGFNGSNASGETRYGTSKNRWRLGVDQRGGADGLFLDTYDGTTGIQVLRATPLGNVGIGTSAPATSAKLEVSSTTQGFLPPRLTAGQRAAINAPAAGLMVFQSDGTKGIYYYDGTSWVNLTNGRVPDANGLTLPPNGGVVSTLAGAPGSQGSADGAALAARFYYPSGVAVDAAGAVYVADASNHTIRKITAAGVVSTVAGTAGSQGSADGTGAAARFYFPNGVAVDAAGTVYVADYGNSTIRKITPAGVVSTLAGTAGSAGSANGTGAAASFYGAIGVAVDAGGTVYVADQLNSTIRKITAAGVVSTLAGATGSAGSADGAGAAARFDNPSGVAVDAAGTVYVADRNNQTIRKITAAGVVSTLAGAAGSSGSADGTGTAARFYQPYGVAVDAAGVVYVADASNSTIRKITAAGVVSTLAGTAGSGGSADGTGAAARFSAPFGVAVDAAGTVYVADTFNNTIRVIK